MMSFAEKRSAADALEGTDHDMDNDGTSSDDENYDEPKRPRLDLDDPDFVLHAIDAPVPSSGSLPTLTAAQTAAQLRRYHEAMDLASSAWWHPYPTFPGLNPWPEDLGVVAAAKEEPDLFLYGAKVEFCTRFPLPPGGMADGGKWHGPQQPILAELTMHREPAACFKVPPRTTAGDESTTKRTTTPELVFLRLADRSSRGRSWSEKEVKRIRQAEVSAKLKENPYFSAHERTLSYGIIKNLMRRLSASNCNFWRVDGRPVFADTDPRYQSDTDPMTELFAFGNGLLSGHATDHAITEAMLPYLRVVVRPIPSEKYTRPTEHEISHGMAPEVVPKKYAYLMQVYLRTAKANRAARCREPGQTQIIRSILSLFPPSRQFPFGGAPTLDSHYAHKLDMAFQKQVIVPAALNTSAHELYVPNYMDMTTEPPTLPPSLKPDALDKQQLQLFAWLLELDTDPTARIAPMPLGDGTSAYIRLGDGGMLYHLKLREFATEDVWTHRMLRKKSPTAVAPPLHPRPVTCAAAMIGVADNCIDEMSTVAALVGANSFQTADPNMAPSYFASRATLIVCKHANVAKWLAHIEEALPASASVFAIRNFGDYDSLSWNDVLLADAVIVTETFLRTTKYWTALESMVGVHSPTQHDTPSADDAYQLALNDHMDDLRSVGRQRYGAQTGGVVLSRVHFHRKILHQGIYDFSFQARFSIGLAHNAQFESPAGVRDMLERLHVEGLPGSGRVRVDGFRGYRSTGDPNAERMVIQTLLNRFARRIGPTKWTRPVLFETELVPLLPQEVGLAVSMAHGDREKQIELLQHPHHPHLRRSGDDTTWPTVDETAQHVQDAHAAKIERLSQDMTIAQQALERDCATIVAKLVTYPAARRWAVSLGLDMADLEDAFTQSQNQVMQGLDMGGTRAIRDLMAVPEPERAAIQAAVVSLNGHKRALALAAVARDEAEHASRFLAAVLGVHNEAVIECPLCTDTLDSPGFISLAKCGHAYCCACADELGAAAHCAVCHEPVGELTRLPIGVNADEASPDVAKYGSKTAAIVRRAAAVLRDHPDTKILAVTQFPGLATVLERALTDHGVAHTSAFRMPCHEAVATFSAGRVFILSPEDAAHAQAAHFSAVSHVLLCHPMVAEDKCTSRAIESMALSNIAKSTSNNAPMSVIRFISQGTAEESLHE